MSPPSRRGRTPGAAPGSVATGAPTPCRSPNGSVSGTDRFAVEPCASFWCVTTSPGLEAVTTAVRGDLDEFGPDGRAPGEGATGTFRQRTDPTKPQIDLYARL